MFGKKSSHRVLWLVGLLVMSGCAAPLEPTVAPDSRNPTLSSVTVDGGEPLASPAGATGGLFYPLTVGNHWGYTRTFTFQIFPINGPPTLPLTIHSTLDKDLIETTQLLGREYVVQREIYREEGAVKIAGDVFYRQDRGGLYILDVPPVAGTVFASRNAPGLGATTDRLLRTSPGLGPYRQAILQVLEKQEMIRGIGMRGRRPVEIERPRPGGPLPGEIAQLVYPLHANKSWHLREDPLFIYTVEKHEKLDLPAGRFNGWRIRIESPLFGSTDHARIWFGRSGQLQLAAHFEGEATDDQGSLIGRVVAHELTVLADLELVRERRTHTSFDSFGGAP